MSHSSVTCPTQSRAKTINGYLELQVSMEELNISDAWESELGHWLNSELRCFGDKGDVEDITEGQLSRAPKHKSFLFADTLLSLQPTLYQPSSSIIPAITLQQETKVVEWCYSKGMNQSVYIPSPRIPPTRPNHDDHRGDILSAQDCLIRSRKKLASTSSTRNSSPTNQNSTTLNP